MKIRNQNPVHVVVRYANAHLSVDDTIARHRDVISKNGSVWFGKIGKPLSEETIKRVNQQVQEEVPSYLYLVTKGSPGGEYSAYKCTIAQMASDLPEKQKKYVPPYYETRGITRQIGFWTKVISIEKIDGGDLRQLHVATSGRSLPHSLARSMAGMFVVQDGEGLTPYG
jgi:hypothetical protein